MVIAELVFVLMPAPSTDFTSFVQAHCRINECYHSCFAQAQAAELLPRLVWWYPVLDLPAHVTLQTGVAKFPDKSS